MELTRRGAPAGDKHGEEATNTMVRARRGCGEGGEESNHPSSGHLKNENVNMNIERRGKTHHAELTPNLVGYISKGQHTDDCSGKHDAVERYAVFCGKLVGRIDSVEN